MIIDFNVFLLTVSEVNSVQYELTALALVWVWNCYIVFFKIVNKIMYAISAWYVFLNISHVLQINSLFKRAFKYGYMILACMYCHVENPRAYDKQ